jgi:hypothetical protein
MQEFRDSAHDYLSQNYFLIYDSVLIVSLPGFGVMIIISFRGVGVPPLLINFTCFDLLGVISWLYRYWLFMRRKEHSDGREIGHEQT